MARPLKQGLDYYPLDCYFLDDIKIRKILRACGTGSIAVLIDLLGNIYRDEGYYMQWDEDICFLVADKVGTSEASVSEIVKKALQVGFFNQELFDEYKILTSSGVQSRFLEATKRRKEVTLYKEFITTSAVNEYNNIKIVTETEPSEVNVYNNPVNVDNNGQSKVKKRKVKQSKVKNAADNTPSAKSNTGKNSASVPKSMQQSQQGLNDYAQVSSFFQENFGMINAFLAVDLEHKVQEMGAELVIAAMKKAITNNRPYSYAQGILRNWRQKGIKTLEDVKAEEVSFQKRNQSRRGKKRVEHVPDWLEDQGSSTTKKQAEDNPETLKELEVMKNQWTQWAKEGANT